MGFLNPCVSCENDSAVLALVSPLPLPRPPKKNHPQPTQKRMPIKTSPHQCDDPGIDPMSNLHLRINCTDPTEDSCPGRITERVLATSRTRLSKFSCHCTGTATVVFPQTNVTTTCTRSMDQNYPLIRDPC